MKIKGNENFYDKTTSFKVKYLKNGQRYGKIAYIKNSSTKNSEQLLFKQVLDNIANKKVA